MSVTYCVDIRERESGNTVECVAQTKSHEDAWHWAFVVNNTLLALNLYTLYFADVYNREGKWDDIK